MASKMSLDDVIEKVADSEDSCSDWEMSEGDLVEGFQTLRTSESLHTSVPRGNAPSSAAATAVRKTGSTLSCSLLSPVSHSGFCAIQAFQESQQLRSTTECLFIN